MRSKFAWVTGAGVIGMCSTVIGFSWLAIWSHLVQAGEPPGSLALELRPPLASRVMIFSGIVLLVVAGLGIAIRRLRKFR
jgi:hypothetical protein